jgi:hypothetical protein
MHFRRWKVHSTLHRMSTGMGPEVNTLSTALSTGCGSRALTPAAGHA